VREKELAAEEVWVGGVGVSREEGREEGQEGEDRRGRDQRVRLSLTNHAAQLPVRERDWP